MTSRAIDRANHAMPERSLSSLFTARLIRAAIARGLPAAALWRCAGIEIDDDDFPPIPERRHLAVWELVMRRLHDPGFPIWYAETVSIDDYGVLGLACKTAATLGAALGVIERYLPAFADTLTVRIDRARLRSTLVLAHDGPPRLGVRCSVESGLAEMLGGIRAVVGTRLAPAAVTFRHAPPHDVTAHRAHFGVTPRFDADVDGLVLPSRALELPVLRADRAVFRYLDRELAALTTARVATVELDWAARVRAEIMRELPRPPRIGSVGRALATSGRTLQRHLAEEATTFARELDHARRELADVLLADRRRSVADVAAAVGFSELSSFARAYRRWTGRAPRSRRAGS